VEPARRAALRRAGRHRRARPRALRPGAVRGGAALHARRPLRPGHPAGQQLLAPRRRAGRGPPARRGSRRDLAARRAAGEKQALRTVLAERLPRRLLDALLDGADTDRPLAQCADAQLAAAAAALHRWRVRPAADAGWDKAEVTLGGVDTRDLSSRTLEARTAPGLYFVGEVVDVTGWLGGFNFQWAWASGRAAGEAC
jgi:hypothetical protein